jgi:2-polyprenyl-3-methyl-5-hydroxy-6-metoxy-1,4-benzoquinol methylase
MREVLCAICGGGERQVVYESTISVRDASPDRIDPYAAHYRINRCRKCDLMYSSPIFEAGEVSALYTQSPHANVVAGEEENVRRTMKGYYRLAQPFLPGRERILDIGCDIGLLLDVARRDGFCELYGIEPVPTAARVARNIPRAVISGEFYEHQVFPDAHFDLITLIHVVDHLVDPGEVLGRAWTQLKPGGMILAVVHNNGSLLSRLLGERFPPYNLYHHYFFSPSTLRRLFERSKFEVLRLVSTYNCYSMRSAVDLLA